MPPLIKRYSHTTTWLTPPDLLEKLGPFDLDPCTPLYMPWTTARRRYRKGIEDGLRMPWFGRVWCNPPFGRESYPWMQRMANYGNGILLIPSATETKWFFQYIWDCAHSICFVRGRLTFHSGNGILGKSVHPSGSCLVAYGTFNSEVLFNSGLGKNIILKGKAYGNH